MALAPALARRGFYYGWYIVGVSFITLFMSMSARSVAFSIFLKPMVAEMGWNRTEFSSALSLGSFVVGLGGLLIGGFLDRTGARPLIITGALVVGGGLIAMSQVRSLWQFYLVRSLIIALGAACISQLVTSVACSNWFVKMRGRALAFSSMGLVMADAVFPFLAGFLVVSLGWRWAWVVLGLLVWAIMLPPAILLMRRRPEDVGLYPDGQAPRPDFKEAPVRRDPPAQEATWTRRQALRTWSLWFLTFAFGLSFLMYEGVGLHFYPYVTDLGYSMNIAAALVSVRSLLAGLSRPFWGIVSERFSLRHVAFIILAGDAVSLFLLLPTGRLDLLFLSALIFGICMGANAPVRETMWADYYGRLSLGKVRSLVMPLDYFFAAAGPIFAGLMWDLTGSYLPAFAFFGAAVLLGGFLALFSRPPHQPAEPQAHS